MNSKIWLSSPHMGGTELNYIKEAFDNNWIAPLGPNVDAFEMSLENYLSDETHVACLSSGTAAIHLALNLLKVEWAMRYCARVSPSVGPPTLFYIAGLHRFLSIVKTRAGTCVLLC